MLRAMRSMIMSAALVLAACGETQAPPKLRKMDFKVDVDQAGRMKVALELFDQKHRPMPVVGSYTVTLARPDGSALCTLSKPLAKTDFNDKHTFQAAFHDAACPADPGAEELKVRVIVAAGEAADAPKLDREVTTPVKYIYRHLAAKAPVDAKKLPAEAPLPEPAPGDGSAGSAAIKPAAASATAAPSAGSAAKPVEPAQPGGSADPERK